MAPRSQKSSGRGRGGEDEKEEPFQAVILADTFETRFAPFTLERPRCLLPLANTPLIEYTLEYLASAGVQEVYLYCGAHVDQVESYINASKWKLSSSPFKTFEFLKTVATSVGDVMRDLDQKHFISGDFLAVSGDIISNFPIEDALKKHKVRREKDKNAIMTVVLRENKQKRARSSDTIVPTFVIDPLKDRCLHYEESNSRHSFGVHIDPDVLSSPELDIRQDLIDCRIDICTPDVLSLWSDNFDNQSLRKDFLYGILKDYELNGKTVHTYIVKDHYAARTGDLLAYDEISQDMKQHWASPLSIENNIFLDNDYRQSKPGVYQEKHVVLARSCKLEPGTIIGRGTSIGAGSTIKNSIIGQRCQIGKNVEIDGAYLWDHVTIGNNVKVLKAIIADEAFIGEKSRIGEGALISFGVQVAPSSQISAGSRLTKSVPADGKASSTINIDGTMHEYEDDSDVDSEEIRRTPGLTYTIPSAGTSNSSLSSLASNMSGGSSTRDPGSRSESFATALTEDGTGGSSNKRSGGHHRTSSTASASGGDSGDNKFHAEAVASLFHRLAESANADDVQVELMGLRFATNATGDQVRRSVAVAMMKHIQHVVDTTSTAITPTTPAEATKQTLKKYRTLIQRADPAGTDSAAAGASSATQNPSEEVLGNQVAFLLDAQRDLVHRTDGARILLFLTKELYDQEIFGEDAFLRWWDDPRSTAPDADAESGVTAATGGAGKECDVSPMAKVRELAGQFVGWLKEAESESESEEEEEDE